MTALPLHASYDIPKGTVLGKYEVLRKIATGGMAEIYVARVRGTAGFEKLVVLKRILPNVAQDPTFVQMFLAEARLAATLQHPNIADVYDVGEVEGTYFFAMEFVHGEDARTIRAATRQRNERPPLAVALAIVQGTAAALDYAHEKAGPQGPLGLVHRDVSASNVIVSYEGAVKLVDFGIARATASEHKTRTGTLKGKIPYMSPEQCRGHQLDRRSDLFSLGTVLYELTVGRRPFRGENDFQMMEQIVHFDVRPPTEIDAEYPKELEAIVLKLLKRDINARYQNADQLLHDLQEFTQAHRLWASPKAIGKYMRSLFAEKIEAWESAERGGVTLAQHVLETSTSQSRPSATPSSAIQPLPPAVLLPTGSYPLAEPSISQIRPALSAPMPIAPPLKSGPRGWIVVSAAVLTLAGVAGGYYVMNRRGQAPANVETKVAPPPKIDPQPVTAPAKIEPPVVVAEPVVAAPVVEPPAAATVAKPVKRTPPVVKKKPISPTPAPIKKKPAESDKEKTWDPNSPFLPPPN
ncbi:MAG: protein kinase [Myxococcota bacterium]|nr:protein kinase [Myxococcota bacterium]